MEQTDFLQTTGQYFRFYKSLAERAMAQLSEAQLFQRPFDGDTDIAIIVNHLAGNLRSRWTDFLTADGEKPWRDRDREFEPLLTSKAAVLQAWEEGWAVLLREFDALQPEDLARTITIRSEPLPVQDAIIRSLTHTAYHVGQIVFLAKSLKGETWKSLSIPKGKSQIYNEQMKR